ncbi:MAG: hydrogenase [Lachnospiraceae bacterium]|nr:hydrogenase [Lachnospiraceae bacterium]
MANYSGLIEQERYTCAIGALQTVVAIRHAVPLLHSGPGCGSMIAGFFERSKGYAGGDTSPCTAFTEKEVVFGGIEKLRHNIENTYKVLDTDLQVVLTGCTGGIVGDDVESLVMEYQDKGKPIVWVDTPGFKSNNLVAHSSVVNAIIDQYVSRFEEENEPRSERNTVNLFASIPYQDPFWKGNLREYKRLLEGLGLKVNVLFGPESEGVKEWQQIPRANFNILVSPWYGKTIVDKLKREYGQDYFWFHYPPIGANATREFLEGVLTFAVEQGAKIDSGKAFSFIDAEENSYYEEIDNLASFLLEFRYGLPKYVHILHDAGYVTGLSRFLLHETGIVPVEQYVVDNTPAKYQEQIQETIRSFSGKRDIGVTFLPDAGLAQQKIREVKEKHDGKGLIIGSSWDGDLAKELDDAYVCAAHPMELRLVLTTNYVGFTGGLRVIEDVYNTALKIYE